MTQIPTHLSDTREHLNSQNNDRLKQFQKILEIRWQEFDQATLQAAFGATGLRDANADFQRVKWVFDAAKSQLHTIQTDAELSHLMPMMDNILHELNTYLGQLDEQKKQVQYNQILASVRSDLEKLKWDIRWEIPPGFESINSQNIHDASWEIHDIVWDPQQADAILPSSLDLESAMHDGIEMLWEEVNQIWWELQKEWHSFQEAPIMKGLELMGIDANTIHNNITESVRDMQSWNIIERITAKIRLWFFGVIGTFVWVENAADIAKAELARLTAKNTEDEYISSSEQDTQTADIISQTDAQDVSPETNNNPQSKNEQLTIWMKLLISVAGTRNEKQKPIYNHFQTLLSQNAILDLPVSTLLQISPAPSGNTIHIHEKMIPQEIQKLAQDLGMSRTDLGHALALLAKQYHHNDNQFRQYILKALLPDNNHSITIRESLMGFSDKFSTLFGWTQIGSTGMDVESILHGLVSHEHTVSYDFETQQLSGSKVQFLEQNNITKNTMIYALVNDFPLLEKNSIDTAPLPHGLSEQDIDWYKNILRFGHDLQDLILNDSRLHLNYSSRMKDILPQLLTQRMTLILYALLEGKTKYEDMDVLEKATLLATIANILGSSQNADPTLYGGYLAALGDLTVEKTAKKIQQGSHIDPEVASFLSGMSEVIFDQIQYSFKRMTQVVWGAMREKPILSGTIIVGVLALPVIPRRTSMAGMILSGRN